MSYDNNKNRIEERVYSVTMTEEEIALFSEFLEQREYARGNVSGMNPNMVRRRVINGRAVIKLSKSSGKSAKQVIRSRVEKEVAANAPKPEYKSEGFRTVETERSKAARKDYQDSFQKNVNKKIHDGRKSVDTLLQTGRKSKHDVKGYDTGNIHTVINNKQYVIDSAKNDGWTKFYKSGNKDHDRNLSALKVLGSDRYAKPSDYLPDPNQAVYLFRRYKKNKKL